MFLDGVAINIQWKICQKSNYQLKVKETKSNPSSGAVKQTVLIAYFYVWLVNNNCCKVKLKLLIFDIFIWQQFADYIAYFSTIVVLAIQSRFFPVLILGEKE